MNLSLYIIYKIRKSLPEGAGIFSHRHRIQTDTVAH